MIAQIRLALLSCRTNRRECTQVVFLELSVGRPKVQRMENGVLRFEKLRESEGAKRIQLMALRLLSCLAWVRLDEKLGG